ncbi:hypothetical protein [Streptomyces roseicoloratus]|uniref:Uncharacterized protein n=1 Tax=Streptomyces roseicoloratus TaxID=2508722 RepID=A0ABY9RSN2_9ACTN|nr:hypothetical protein [Streptomyces roseicoloratus]WMX44698.1 hypothetical protein RGF97_07250 [Streptomyces roseicoloratus]
MATTAHSVGEVGASGTGGLSLLGAGFRGGAHDWYGAYGPGWYGPGGGATPAG